jgi:hypothetical protein
MKYVIQKLSKVTPLASCHHGLIKALMAVCLFAFMPSLAHAQSYDPFTSNAIIAPAPMLPVEFGGTGTFTFQAGNNGGDALIFPALNGNAGNLMGLVISLANGVPNVPGAVDIFNPTAAEALTAISGPLLSFFDFTYNPGIRTYTGVQIAAIPAFSSIEAVIQYRVAENTFIGSPFNGANVNVQPPGYTNPQPTDNDQASSFTYVQASDFGDAPVSGVAQDGLGTNSYGSATHAINVAQDTNDVYTNYWYLGASVDHEDVNQDSPGADGDDVNQSNGLAPSDDENGVSFPALIPGQLATITVDVTNQGSGFAFLNAWIDWNGDGDFADAGEQIIASPGLFIFGTSTQNINVTVPANAILNALTFARFRLGNPVGSAGADTFGEVEDYVIFIGDPTAVTIGDVDIEAASVDDFLDGLSVDKMSDEELLKLLDASDPGLAASSDGSRESILSALRRYLDPDGDGRVAILRWDTLEERGTVGFYVTRTNLNSEVLLINDTLLPGMVFAPLGAEYILADPTAEDGQVYQYRFIELETSGNTREYGPFELELN